MSPIIEQGSKVTLHFSLQLDDGSIVDATPGQQPASLVIGDGNLPPGFEQQLLGLIAGDERTVPIPPEKAFGMPNPNNIQCLPRGRFGNDVELEEGLVLSFTDAADGELPGVICRIDEQTVEVDFNHPLAGRHLVFNVRIVAVQTP